MITGLRINMYLEFSQFQALIIWTGHHQSKAKLVNNVKFTQIILMDRRSEGRQQGFVFMGNQTVIPRYSSCFQAKSITFNKYLNQAPVSRFRSFSSNLKINNRIRVEFKSSHARQQDIL